MKGTLCARGHATLESHHDPMRITVPLKRAGKHGEGKWKPITWEDLVNETVVGETYKIENYRSEVMLDQISMTERRYKIYDLLSYAFINEPTEELILALKDLGNLFDEINGDNIASIDVIKLKDYNQEFYDRLFVNSSPLYIPPFEAAIRNRGVGRNKKIKYGRLDSEETFHVKSCYMMVDFDPNTLNMFEPLRNSYFQDNIGFELGFMAFLSNKELISIRNKNEKNAKDWAKLEVDFLENHLSTWVHDYAKLTEEKMEGLYSFIANIASEWVKLDKEYLLEDR